MRDTYVFFVLLSLIAASAFLAYTGKAEANVIMTPLVTGFFGLLAEIKRSNVSGTTTVPMTLLQRLGISKPPPSLPISDMTHDSEPSSSKKAETK